MTMLKIPLPPSKMVDACDPTSREESLWSDVGLTPTIYDSDIIVTVRDRNEDFVSLSHT